MYLFGYCSYERDLVAVFQNYFGATEADDEDLDLIFKPAFYQTNIDVS